MSTTSSDSGGRGATPWRIAGLTLLALVGFAANSVLCRAALGGATIDAASFSSLRLASGAATLVLLHRALARRRTALAGGWLSALLLFLYAVPFSFAYETLAAGTGALILFGAVQATMILAALAAGERPHPLQWLGLATALGGLVYLVLPGLDAPEPAGAALMTVAGIAWGLYSLRGRGTSRPLAETAGNFLRSLPMVALVSLAALGNLHVTAAGAVLAAASGALASGVGYALWYAALPGLTATLAATVQLSVPVLAAAGGVLFLSERVSLRLVIAAVLILGGVALTLRSRRPGGRVRG